MRAAGGRGSAATCDEGRADRYSVRPMDSAANLVACSVNGEAAQLPAGTSVAALLERLRLRPEVVAVEIDARLVPRATWAARTIAAGERVEVVTLVGGG